MPSQHRHRLICTVTDESDTRKPAVTVYCGGIEAQTTDGFKLLAVALVRPSSVSAARRGPERLNQMVSDFALCTDDAGTLRIGPDFSVKVRTA